MAEQRSSDSNCSIDIIDRKTWLSTSLSNNFKLLPQYHKSAVWKGDVLVTGGLEYFEEQDSSGGNLKQWYFTGGKWSLLFSVFTGLEFGRCLATTDKYLAARSSPVSLTKFLAGAPHELLLKWITAPE